MSDLNLPNPRQPSSSGYSSTSSRGSSMGRDPSSMVYGGAVQEQRSRFNEGQYSNILPSNVKLPPSYQSQGHSLTPGDYRPQPTPRPAPQSHDLGPTHGTSTYNAVPMSVSQGGGERSISQGAVPVQDIVRKLDFASKENLRLRNVLHENNELLDSKLMEIEQCLGTSMSLKKEVEDLKSENGKLKKTNEDLKSQCAEADFRFFEARVAVMGYKCRTMQLQGEVTEREKRGGAVQEQPRSLNVPNEAHYQQEIQRLKAQNSQLMTERQSWAQHGGSQALADEKKSLEAVIAQLRCDLDEVTSKKEAARKDANSLGEQVRQLTMELSAVRQESYQVQVQMQQLSQQKSAVEDELKEHKKRTNSLMSKVNEMEEAKTSLHEKLQRYSQEPPPQRAPPVPKPRTNIQPVATLNLQAKEQLEREKRELQEQLDREKSLRSTAERQHQRQNEKAQEMIKKQNRLEDEVLSLSSQLAEKQHQEQVLQEEIVTLRRQVGGDRLKVEMESLQRSMDRKEGYVKALEQERAVLQSKVAGLEQQITEQSQRMLEEKHSEVARIKKASDREIADLRDRMDKMQLEPTESLPSGAVAKPGGKQQTIAKRLNDALGRIRQLEAEKKRLENELGEERDKFETEKGHLIRENTKLHQVATVEQEQKLRNAESRMAELQRQMSSLEQEERRLLEENMKQTDEKDRLRQDLSLKDTTIREAEHRLSSLQRELSEKRRDTERLNVQLEHVQGQLSTEEQERHKHSGKMESLQSEHTKLKERFSRMRTELGTIQDEKETFQTRIHELNTEREQLSHQKTQLIVEKTEVETTCREFRHESESLLQDYDSCAQKLQQVKEEKEQLQAQYSKLLTETSQRADRVKQLEGQRKEAQERLSHMDAQLKIYHEDFDRERQAREAAIKVKNLAEERMKKMEKDMKELRDRLNRQAAMRLQEEQVYDESSSAGGGGAVAMETRRSGEQPPPPRQLSGPQQYNHPPQAQPQQQPGANQLFAQPQTFAGGQQQYPQPQARRSGEQQPSQFTQQPVPRAHHHQQQPQQQEQVPPIPPRERVLQGGGGLPAPGGGVQGVQPTHGRMDMQQNDLNQGPMRAQVPGHVSMATGGGYPMQQRDMRGGQNIGGGDTPWTTQQFATPPPQQQQPPQPRMHPQTVAHTPRNNLNAPPQSNIGVAPPPGGLTPPPAAAGAAGQQGHIYKSPGEVLNAAPPKMACPLCGKQDFKTQTELELHCAQCT